MCVGQRNRLVEVLKTELQNLPFAKDNSTLGDEKLSERSGRRIKEFGLTAQKSAAFAAELLPYASAMFLPNCSEQLYASRRLWKAKNVLMTLKAGIMMFLS